MIEYWKNFSLENLFYIDENGVVQEEEWRDVFGFEGIYKCSLLGRIKRLSRVKFVEGTGSGTDFIKVSEMIMKQGGHRDGYLKISLRKNGLDFSLSSHRIIATSFLPNPENKPEVNHKGENPNKKDNRVWMIEWSTKLENAKHAKENGLRENTIGEKNYNSKLTVRNVIFIKRLQKRYGKFNMAKLSRKLNVSETTVSYVVKNKIWKHIEIS